MLLRREERAPTPGGGGSWEQQMRLLAKLETDCAHRAAGEARAGELVEQMRLKAPPGGGRRGPPAAAPGIPAPAPDAQAGEPAQAYAPPSGADPPFSVSLIWTSKPEPSWQRRRRRALGGHRRGPRHPGGTPHSSAPAALASLEKLQPVGSQAVSPSVCAPHPGLPIGPGFQDQRAQAGGAGAQGGDTHLAHTPLRCSGAAPPTQRD